jgi:hypothetical protein
MGCKDLTLGFLEDPQNSGYCGGIVVEGKGGEKCSELCSFWEKNRLSDYKVKSQI